MNERDLKPVGMLVGDKWDKMHDISRRVYDEDGVSPTIPTGAGGNTEVKILQVIDGKIAVREATKKGYTIAEEGDSIDTSYPNSKTRRGRVGKGIAHTLTAEPPEQVVVVGAIRGRNPDNPSDRTAGAPTVQMLEIRDDECTNTITSVQKDNVVIETDARAETFPDDYIVTIDGKPCLVRKLIPKECWRLFGFTDEQFETAKKALEEKHYHGKDKASSQLYKQAGNTIVIPMLAAVLRSIKGIQTKEVNS